MKRTSEKRIKTFVDGFIRSDKSRNGWGDSSDDFINDPDRAERCHDAAEYGSDGSTHREIINDWRESFTNWVRDEHRNHNDGLFVDAVNAYFDGVEEYHTKAGTIDEQLG
jgi:hypothetical protein